MIAQDLMTSKPITLDAASGILQAAEVFRTKRISSIPVLTNTGEIMGQLTDLGMARAVVLHQLQGEKYRQLFDCKDLMDPPVIVAGTDSIATVVRAMMKSQSHRVLVKGAGYRLTGIISPKDLLRMLNTAGEVNSALQHAIHRWNKD